MFLADTLAVNCLSNDMVEAIQRTGRAVARYDAPRHNDLGTGRWMIIVENSPVTQLFQTLGVIRNLDKSLAAQLFAKKFEGQRSTGRCLIWLVTWQCPVKANETSDVSDIR